MEDSFGVEVQGMVGVGLSTGYVEEAEAGELKVEGPLQSAGLGRLPVGGPTSRWWLSWWWWGRE